MSRNFSVTSNNQLQNALTEWYWGLYRALSLKSSVTYVFDHFGRVSCKSFSGSSSGSSGSSFARWTSFTRSSNVAWPASLSTATIFPLGPLFSCKRLSRLLLTIFRKNDVPVMSEFMNCSVISSNSQGTSNHCLKIKVPFSGRFRPSDKGRGGGG